MAVVLPRDEVKEYHLGDIVPILWAYIYQILILVISAPTVKEATEMNDVLL